jgi:hypothetical protein
MPTTPTTEDLLATEAGQAMLAEIEERQAAEEAAEEYDRSVSIAAWSAERETLADLYTTLRDVVLAEVESLAGHTEELGRLLRRIGELDGYLRKNGADVPFSVRLDSRRKVSLQVRAIAQRLVARL